MDQYINRTLVHKQHSKNVLLSNLRRILPRALPLETMELAAGHVSPEDYQLLLRVYRPLGCPTILGQGKRYILREFLGALRLTQGQYQEVLQALPEDTSQEFTRLYSPHQDSRERTRYYLESPVDDDLLNRIIKQGGKAEYYIDNGTQARASAILESLGYPQVPQEDIRDIFLANMVVDTSHEFFFEHPNEHVPGIMILEACRQMIIACSHSFGGVSREHSHMILDLLEARFTGFLELYAPIILRAEVIQKREHRGAWTSVALDITIHQNGSQLGRVTCSGSTVGSGAFKRIRRLKRDELGLLPFIPGPDLDYTLLVKPQEESVWQEARLQELNLKTLVLRVPPSDTPPANRGVYDFVLVVSGAGSAKGQCTMASRLSNGLLRFTLESLSRTEEEQLELILKRYCKVPERAVI